MTSNYFRQPTEASGAQAQLDRDEAYRRHLEKERERRHAAHAAKFEAERAAREKQVEAWNAADALEAEERAATRERERRDRTRTAERELKARLKANFLEQPGATEAGFTAAWPDLLRRIQIERTLAAGDPVATLAAEMKALRRGGGEHFERQPLPVPVESE